MLRALGLLLILIAFGLFLAWVLTGCGVAGEFSQPVVVQCTNGRVLDLREWTPYMGVGSPNYLVNKRTGEQITDDGVTKCYPLHSAQRP